MIAVIKKEMRCPTGGLHTRKLATKVMKCGSDSGSFNVPPFEHYLHTNVSLGVIALCRFIDMHPNTNIRSKTTLVNLSREIV